MKPRGGTCLTIIMETSRVGARVPRESSQKHSSDWRIRFVTEADPENGLGMILCYRFAVSVPLEYMAWKSTLLSLPTHQDPSLRRWCHSALDTYGCELKRQGTSKRWSTIALFCTYDLVQSRLRTNTGPTGSPYFDVTKFSKRIETGSGSFVCRQ
jgi:hypothetical protein